jgi:hypothetical protein
MSLWGNQFPHKFIVVKYAFRCLTQKFPLEVIMFRVALTAVLAAVLLTSAGAAHGAPLQSTPPDLGGQWKTVSLTQNRIGYEMNLKKAGAGNNAYEGTLQFRHRDGRKTKSTMVGVAVGKQSQGSYRVTIVMPGGSLASGKSTVTGRLSKTDGSMYFPKCSQIWPLAMKGEEDTDCLFREIPS